MCYSYKHPRYFSESLDMLTKPSWTTTSSQFSTDQRTKQMTHRMKSTKMAVSEVRTVAGYAALCAISLVFALKPMVTLGSTLQTELHPKSSQTSLEITTSLVSEQFKVKNTGN